MCVKSVTDLKSNKMSNKAAHYILHRNVAGLLFCMYTPRLHALIFRC